MGRLAVVVMLLGSMSAFGQLVGVDGFRKNKHGLYEMSFKDVREAIRKYNYVTDMNGADTTDGDKYKIMFGEFDGTEEKYFFTIRSDKNKPLDLVYRLK
jgi:hypothetical protein